MSSPLLGSPGNPAGANLSQINRTLVATYSDYASAQRAVDHLSDQKFPVEHTAIVGSDLRLVEQITGRLTTGRAALAGAGSGAWFGLFLGLLIGLFTDQSFGGWLALVLTAIVIGAVWGGLFGLVAHSLSGGRRDFASRSGLVAGKYDVMVTSEFANQARTTIEQLA